MLDHKFVQLRCLMRYLTIQFEESVRHLPERRKQESRKTKLLSVLFQNSGAETHTVILLNVSCICGTDGSENVLAC